MLYLYIYLYPTRISYSFNAGTKTIYSFFWLLYCSIIRDLLGIVWRNFILVYFLLFLEF